jgi:hypothetical protein
VRRSQQLLFLMLGWHCATSRLVSCIRGQRYMPCGMGLVKGTAVCVCGDIEAVNAIACCRAVVYQEIDGVPTCHVNR